MSIAQKLKEEGRQEGIEKGLLSLRKLYEKGIISKQIYLEEVEKLIPSCIYLNILSCSSSISVGNVSRRTKPL
jgi:hypothetical protein